MNHPVRPARGPSATSDPFYRSGRRHRFTARRVNVRAVEALAVGYTRVTLVGPELHDFEATGPADHVRVFFPDPVSGALSAPEAVGPDADGILPAHGRTYGRDFTPLNIAMDPETGARCFDIDIFQHPSPGPAVQWSQRAVQGDRLVVVGPKGSRNAPAAQKLLLIVDGSALPSTLRWVQSVPASSSVTVLIYGSMESSVASDYLAGEAGDREVSVTPAGHDLEAALRRTKIDDKTYVFAAGEADRLVGVRRYLRDDLHLSADQFTVSGYWKRGQAAFDHHQAV